MELNRHDAILLELLNDTTSIVDFLDAIFAFLARRTDFYHTMNEEDTIGFPAGFKEELVFNALKKYDKIYNMKKEDLFIEETPPVAEHVEVESTEDFMCSSQKQKQKQKENCEIGNIFQPNEYYNGASYENYSWGQSISDVEIHVLLPKEITSPKLLSVKIEVDYISIKQKNTGISILDGKLSRKCKYGDAVWSLSGGKIQISIDKTQEVWWNRLFENEPILDLSKMDCTRPIEELPEESQIVIEKLHWDQQQKALGLATSEDLENQERLKKAWNAEGSPFKGKTFEPNIVRFN